MSTQVIKSMLEPSLTVTTQDSSITETSTETKELRVPAFSTNAEHNDYLAASLSDDALAPTDSFVRRHIGASSSEIQQMPAFVRFQ